MSSPYTECTRAFIVHSPASTGAPQRNTDTEASAVKKNEVTRLRAANHARTTACSALRLGFHSRTGLVGWSTGSNDAKTQADTRKGPAFASRVTLARGGQSMTTHPAVIVASSRNTRLYLRVATRLMQARSH
eukprot:scaffold599_cov130-Isochrysis_galbana.AAC.2